MAHRRLLGDLNAIENSPPRLLTILRFQNPKKDAYARLEYYLWIPF